MEGEDGDFLSNILLNGDPREAAVPREEGGPKIFIGRRMKLFAWDG